MSKPGIGQLIAGAGGALLIISLFLPWADARAPSRNGWELWTMADVFLLIAATMALVALVTGGRMNLFRPDMSVNAAADLLGVVSTLLLCWLRVLRLSVGRGQGDRRLPRADRRGGGHVRCRRLERAAQRLAGAAGRRTGGSAGGVTTPPAAGSPEP